MEFSKVIDSRYSVRKYKDVEIEREKIEKIIDAGHRAPTAKNTNCVSVYAVTGKSVLEKA